MATDVKELKIRQEYFEAVISKEKTFEIRYDDRNFQVGDVLVLREYEGYYTGRTVIAKVTYVLSDFEGLKEGYVVMSIKLIWGGYDY